MPLTLSCKLVEVFAMICVGLLQNQAQDSVALNPAFAVTPIESPRYGGPSLWRTAIRDRRTSTSTTFIIYFWQPKAGLSPHAHANT